MKKRILSFALAVLMVVACVPAIALGSSAEAQYGNALAGLIGTCSDGETTKQLTILLWHTVPKRTPAIWTMTWAWMLLLTR